MKPEAVTSLEDLIDICKSKNNALDDTDVRNAYELISERLKSSDYKNIEAVITHSLREASMVAEWGLGKDIVVASLLHETAESRVLSRNEISGKFGDNVVYIIDSVAEMSDRSFFRENKGLRITEYDDLPRKKAINNAIYVKIADRIDKLKFGDGVLDIPPVFLTNMTQRELFRLVKRVNAYRFVDELQELCFEIDRPDTYKEIVETCEALRNENVRSFRKTTDMLASVFDPHADNENDELAEYRSQIKQLVIEGRSYGSIIRHLKLETDGSFDGLNDHLRKDKVPLYDIVLVVEDKLSEDISKFVPNDVFFKCFEKSLMDEGIYITDHQFTTRDDRDFFVLADETDNLYRFYVRTQKEYRRFMYGEIADEPEFQFQNEKQEMELPEPRRPKIKVFKDDGTDVLITNGATVLDFAFSLSAETGLHFDYAMLNESKTRLDRNVRLNEGDTVTIVTDRNVLPDISWFESANTGMAKKYLVDHFSKRENLERLL
ncbi:MAG: HD domain-containing protein [Clostridiales bacterium]|nr:HD domain-containing protein [Clostridiales bacterium]